MKTKFILAGVFLVTVGLTGLVFGGGLNFKTNISYVGSVAETIYPGNPVAAKNVVIFKSNTNLSSGGVVSSCDISSKFVLKQNNYYFFLIDYKNDPNCSNDYISFSLGEELYPHATGKIKVESPYELYNTHLDYSTQFLKQLQQQYLVRKQKNSVYKTYDGKDFLHNFNLFKGQRKYIEASYMESLVSGILDMRSKKYSSPVPGRVVSEQVSLIPNAARPYRAAYTDGIHHGWDIVGNFGEDLVALDHGMIVRIVDSFDDTDFSRIEYSKDLSENQKLKNLDILRGKQVWLKTMKGEVVFYSHLEDVEADLYEGMLVQQGKKLGTIGVSGVPQDDYDHYHLHFSIMENPYNNMKAGSYDFGDYMSWDWLTRGLDVEQTRKAAYDIFDF